MAKEFKLPDLGEGVDSGDVVAVHVAEGDVIKPEQTVLEIETDKAVLEVPCSFGGKVTKVHVEQGDKVSVGSPLISVDVNGAEGTTTAPAKSDDDKSKKQDKDQEAAGAKGAEPKKEKPSEEADGEEKRKEKKPKEAASDEKQEAAGKKKDEPDEDEDTEPADRSRREKKPEPSKRSERSSGEDGVVPAGPATRRLARELGVDLRTVADAHPGERITEDLLKAFVRKGNESTEGMASRPDTPATATAPALPDFSQWGEIESEELTKLQRKTAENMAVAWSQVAHVTQFDEADVGALENLRQRFKETDKGKDVKLTVTAFIVKAAGVALRAFPRVNASLDLANNRLILKRYYHVGVAVDTEAGLIVPVIRDVNRKRVLDIAREMADLAERTRLRKVGLDELRGATFTVTNLGGIGGTGFAPIVNYPEVAILGVARAREVPVLEDGRLSTRLMLPLSLSYDHRVINGADGARFLRRIAELLEDPEMLLLEG